MSGKSKKRKIEECDRIPYIPIGPSTFLNAEEIEDDACKCTGPGSKDDNYKMDHKKRGRAIIFNHYLCHGHSQPRKGTECDVMRLGRSLSNILNFEVKVYQDLKHCEIMEVLFKLSKENFCHEDCLAVFVLTHGSLHGLTAADESYPVEELWQNFIPSKCATLAGKPKLFFINSCRGNKFDEGVIYESHEAEAVSSNEASTKRCVSYRAPLLADFLTFYSTMEGFTSLRHPSHGTWFIQSLCETLENKNYRKLELKQILTITTRKTALKCNQYSERVCQIPTMMSTLIRNSYRTSFEVELNSRYHCLMRMAPSCRKYGKQGHIAVGCRERTSNYRNYNTNPERYRNSSSNQGSGYNRSYNTSRYRNPPSRQIKLMDTIQTADL